MKVHTKYFNNGVPTIFSTHSEGQNNKIVKNTLYIDVIRTAN